MNDSKTQDPNAWYDAHWAKVMEVSRQIAERRIARNSEAQEFRGRERHVSETLALLREMDPYFRGDREEVAKSGPDPATADALREVADLLRQILERPQPAPQVVVNLPPEILARIAPFKTKTTVQRNDRGGITGSTTEVVS